MIWRLSVRLQKHTVWKLSIFLHHIGTVCIIAVASKDELQSDFREVGLLYRGEHGVHCAMNKAYTVYLPYLQEFEVDKL